MESDNSLVTYNGPGNAAAAAAGPEAGGFLPGVPIWAYIVIALLGLVSAAILFSLAGRARRQHGGSAAGPTALAILSLVLLTIVPIVLMIIALTSNRSSGVTVAGNRIAPAPPPAASVPPPGDIDGRAAPPQPVPQAAPQPGEDGASAASSARPARSMFLETALATAASQYRSRLPMRSGPLTITSVVAAGDTLRIGVRVDKALTAAEVRGFERQAQQMTCTGPPASLVGMGARIDYAVTDASGETLSTTVDRC